MILATSAIGVAALAIGGALAFGVTTPQDEPPAPAAERVSTAPAAFTASMMPGPCPDDEAWCYPSLFAVSDPRLQGTARWQSSQVEDVDQELSINYSGISIETDDGLWRQLPQIGIEAASLDWPELRGDTWVLVGEGGYDGLVAVASTTSTDRGVDLAGYILDIELPPLPSILVDG